MNYIDDMNDMGCIDDTEHTEEVMAEEKGGGYSREVSRR